MELHHNNDSSVRQNPNLLWDLNKECICYIKTNKNGNKEIVYCTYCYIEDNRRLIDKSSKSKCKFIK